MSAGQELALPRDFGSVEPTVYDALRKKFGIGRSVRYFFEGGDCSRISLASDEGPILRDIPVPARQRKHMGRLATSLLNEISVLTDESREWLFDGGFTLHSITYDTRHVSPSTCHRQPQPHFDAGRVLFTGEHFGPSYLVHDDMNELVPVESEGGRLVGHDQTTLHHSRPSPLSTRQSRAVVKVSAGV